MPAFRRLRRTIALAMTATLLSPIVAVAMPPNGSPPASSAVPRTVAGDIARSVSLAPAHRLFSTTIASALSAAGVTAATPRAAFAPPAGSETLSAVALGDETRTSGALECVARASGDSLRIEETPVYLVATIACERGVLHRIGDPRGTAGAHRFSIAYRKAAIAQKFERSTGIPIARARFAPEPRLAASPLARDPYLRMAQTKDELELAGCIAGFQRFRSGAAGYFHAVFFARVYHCEVDSSREHARVTRSALLANPRRARLRANGMSPADRPELFTPETVGTNEEYGGGGTTYHAAAALQVRTAQLPGTPKPAAGIAGAVAGLRLAYGARDFQISSGIVQIATSPSAPVNAATCDAILHPPGLALNYVNARLAYAPVKKGLIGSQIDRYPLTATTTVPLPVITAQYTYLRASKQQADLMLFARVVPSDATGTTCTGTPTTWLPVAVHDSYPKEAADLARRTADEMRRTAVTGDDGHAGSPISVASSPTCRRCSRPPNS